MEPAPPPRRRLLLYLVAAVLVISLLLGAAELLTVPTPAPPPYVPTVSANLTFNDSAPTTTMAPGFFGINVRPDYPLSEAPGTNLSGSPIVTVRWPGGSIADRLDALHDLLYDDDGLATTPASNLSEFVAWCEAQACRAILQLPTEIDEPDVAAAEVGYVVGTLHFEPAYWELGDEPADWTHFGLPWTAWNSSQELNATPSTYAAVVQGYVAAIRGVDPAAHVLGLGGVGLGASGEAGWLSAVAARNGPNLSGYAIHVYPAGSLTSSAGGLPAFYGTLQGAGSIPARVAADRAALEAACPACGPPNLLVTELGSGNGTTPYQAAMAGFPEVSYVTAELLEGLEANLTSLELFAYEADYNGSFVTPSPPATHPVRVLYDNFLPWLDLGPPLPQQAGPVSVYPLATQPAVPGLFALLTSDGSPHPYTLVLVDTSPDQVELTLHLGLPFAGAGVVRNWSAGEAAPAPPGSGAYGGSTVTLQPQEVAELWSGPPSQPDAVPKDRPGPGTAQAPLTVTRVSVPLMPGMRRILWTTTSSASLTCPAWIFTMRSKGPVTASTSTTWGTCRTFRRTSSSLPISASTRR